MIVDARAITYLEMENYVNKRPVSLHVNVNTEEGKIAAHDEICIVSITDVDMQRIFKESIPGKVCSLVFNDCEPNGIPTFKPDTTMPEFMTSAQANELVDFIDDLHSSNKRILLLVNCKHGMCRSGAVVNYVGHIASLGFWSTKRKNPQIVPNYWVQYQLFKAHFEKKARENQT
jgi:predicted protein tyrosine phosphatase